MPHNQNTSVSLGEHFTRFITASVREGRYSSARDVVRAGPRLLEEHEAKLKTPREVIAEGEQSGHVVRVLHGSMDIASLLEP